MRIDALPLAILAGLIATVCDDASAAQTWPRLSGEIAKPQCQQAYRLGLAAFRSTNAELSWPVVPPANLGSSIAVHRVGVDISGGEALQANEQLFSRTDSTPSEGRVLWANAATSGKRMAILETPAGWRGDLYSVFLLEASERPESLLSLREAGPTNARRPKPFIGETWRPPLVLMDDKQHVLWAIEFHPFEYVGDWQVYTFEGGETHVACRMAFHPPMSSNLSLLPRPVRRWAALLDEALGPGLDEGTLQPTARIRSDLKNLWVNASLRPWALVTPRYNTTEEVEAGLSQWSRRVAARRNLLGRIRGSHAEAERALGAYYQARFALDPVQARRSAAFVMDYMLRSSFVFPVDGGGRLERRAVTNPWPADVREGSLR